MKFKPTTEQSCAIETNENMLVSAAAGSGKTAVLVERVIRLICDTKRPLSADKLLIVTFTNASAAELKVRIEKRLNELIAEEPFNHYLTHQKILLANAKICTIDSFCIDFIRENFEKAGVDPSFKIADNSVIRMFMASSMANLMNDEFNSGNEEFLSLLDYIGSTYDDSELSNRIESIFEYSRQMPYPSEWLKEKVAEYQKNATGESDEWFLDAISDIKENTKQALLFAKNAVSSIELMPEAFEKYKDNLLYINEFTEKLNNLTDWDKIYELLSSYAPPPLKRLTAEQKTSDVVYGISQRDKAIDIIKALRGFVYANKQFIKEEIYSSYSYVKKICELVNSFEARLYSALSEGGFLTFYMAEQIALSLLSKYEDGAILRADNADEFISAYDAVLVDEYQDTNDLQDCIFSIISNDEKNLFCVGDAKQSIYRFRGANPNNFITKKKYYKDKDDADRRGLRVDLSGNFRSRKEICDYVNRFFEFIMHESNAEIEYDSKEKLISLAEFPESFEAKTECHYIDMSKMADNRLFEDENDSNNKIIAEANVIAELIEQTISAEPFIKDGDGLRTAQYGDITILLRSPSSAAEMIASILRKRGIPTALPLSNPLESDEITTIISLLKIINNPFDDIALLTVMTSPLYMFTMDELAEIRGENTNGKLISAITLSQENNPKVKAFLKSLSKYRETNAVSKVYELIDEIYETTNFTGVVSRLEDGKSKKANLKMLQNLALSFENDGRKSLREFLKSIEGLSASDIKAPSVEDKSSVKMMSIHSSKGLQFPVCIIADTDRKFNFADSNSSLLIDEHYGFSFKYYDENKKEKSDTLLRLLMSRYQRNKLLSEEVRLLYVAMTRAEEKLIITTCFKDLGKELDKLADMNFTDNGKVNDYFFKKTTSYSDWILAEDFLYNFEQFSNYLNGNDSPYIHTSFKNVEENNKETFTANTQMVEKLINFYSKEYPYEELINIEAKASVTDIVHKADDKQYRFSSRPAFMNSEKMTGAEKGTATHKFMQFCDYEKACSSVSAECERLYEGGYLTYEESKIADNELVRAFFDSDLYARIKVSPYVKKEMNFLTEFSAEIIKPDIAESLKGEKIIVQGAVDLIFEENGKIVIVDFKTDRNKNEDELRGAYAEQLLIYKKACENLLKKPVDELIIYSFLLGREIRI